MASCEMQHHPATVLRFAWDTLRLDVIHVAVETAIREVHELNRREVPASLSARAPTRMALLDCCAELRAESGMPPIASPPDTLAGPEGERTPDWVECFESALARYRDAAGISLTRSFGNL